MGERDMNNRMGRFLTGAVFACGVAGGSAWAQEGDLVQKEKARHEQELRERNAQPKAKQPVVSGQAGAGQAAEGGKAQGSDKPMQSSPPKRKKSKGTPPAGKE
jgi:hypothetical protein